MLVDGRAVSGCLYLAVFVDGAEVVTVEHLATGSQLSPVQEAFIESGAFQCGYCTPGFILMAKQLLDEHPDPGRRPDPALSVRQSVPLRHLPAGYRGGEARGEEALAQGRIAGLRGPAQVPTLNPTIRWEVWRFRSHQHRFRPG